MVGTRIVTQVKNCSKDYGTDLYHNFCKVNKTAHAEHEHLATKNLTILASAFDEKDYVCDPYFVENKAGERQGIRGLTSEAFKENLFNKYMDPGHAISNSTTEKEYNLGGNPKFGYVLVDIYTSFTLLVGIFFPSCTGKAKN